MSLRPHSDPKYGRKLKVAKVGLVEARPDDLFVRWRVDPAAEDPVVVDGDHVGWIRQSANGEAWGTALGSDLARVVRLIERLDDLQRLDGVTVPDDAFEGLPERLRSPDPGHWSFWVLDPIDAGERQLGASELALDDPRIGPLLVHSDSAHIFPGDPRIVRWSGVEVDGDLVAVAAQVTERGGAVHIVSVCTHPDHRGQGLAQRACNGIIVAGLREKAPVIYLEMYAANEAGRRAYTALGFTEVGRYRSGLLQPR